MLITKTSEEDKAEIFKLWQEYFYFDDGGYTDYHFQHDYFNVANYVLKEEGKLISCLQVSQRQMVINDRVYDYDFIAGVITKKEYQHQGYMRKLLSAVLSRLQAPLILIQAYNPEIYRSFGFIDVYYRKQLILPASDIAGLPNDSRREVTLASLLELYQEFTADKNGYCLRDLAYYQRKQELWQAQGNLSYMIKIEDKLSAYCVYTETNAEINIEELVYLNDEAAYHTVSYLYNKGKRIIVELMASEHCLDSWQKAANNRPATMVLFNKPEVVDLAQLQKKELYFNEYE